MPTPSGAVTTLEKSDVTIKRDFDIVEYAKKIDPEEMKQKAIARAAAKAEGIEVDNFDIVEHVESFDFSTMKRLTETAKARTAAKAAVQATKKAPVKVVSEDNYNLASSDEMDIKKLTVRLITNISPFWR